MVRAKGLGVSLARDESNSQAPRLATKYGICFQRVTVLREENHRIESMSQFDTISRGIDRLKRLKPWVSGLASLALGPDR